MAQEKLEENLAPATWLKQTTLQIQVLDYELHATLRSIAAGETLDSAQKRALMAAISQRGRLMTRVIRHVVDESTQ
jgi:hypothetical protein